MNWKKKCAAKNIFSASPPFIRIENRQSLLLEHLKSNGKRNHYMKSILNGVCT
jgi:hypothetical protein